MTDPTRPALEALRREFLRASSMYPPLYHQRLVDLYEENAETVDAWRAFAAANTSTDWQAWHGPVFGLDAWLGRFYGNEAGLTEFKQLADGLYSVIRQIDRRWDAESEEGKWGGSVGSRASGFEVCLDLLHTIAICWPTQIIRSKETRWGLWEEHERAKNAIGAKYADDEELASEDLEKLNDLDALEESIATGESGAAFMVHPWVGTIQTNLFSAFVSLIDMILDDDNAFFISDEHFSEPDYPRLGQGKLIAEEVTSNPQYEAKSAESEGDYLFAFDARRRQWHIRFRWGKGPADVEEDWIERHKVRVGQREVSEYVAFMLERSHQPPIPCTKVFHTFGPTELRSAVSRSKFQPEASFQRESRQGKDDPDKREWANVWRKINDRKEALTEARANSDEAEEAKVEEELKYLYESLNEYNRAGTLKEKLSVPELNAANRVRNAIDRFKKMLSPKGKHPLPHLYEHLKVMEVWRGVCFYMPPLSLPPWKVVWPSRAE